MQTVTRFIFLLCAWMTLTGCHTVEIDVRNPQPIDLEAWVEITDEDGLVNQTIELGPVTKDHGHTRSRFTAQPGLRFEVHARVPQSAIVYKFGPVTITNQTPSPYLRSVVLDPLNVPFAETGSSDLTHWAQATRDQGPTWENFESIDANEGARRYWGALLVVQEPRGDKAPGKILYEVPASVFSTVHSVDEYPRVRIDGQAWINADAVDRLLARFPEFGSVLGDVNVDDATRISWKIRDYGWLSRPAQQDFNVLTAIWSLPEVTKREIIQVLRDDPDAQLMFVSQIYVIKQMTVTANRGQRLDRDDPVDADCVVKPDGVYRFDRDQEQTQAQAMKLVNISGVVWQPHFARVNIRNTGYEFIEDPRLDLLVDDFVKNRVILLPKKLTLLGPGSETLTVSPDLKALENLAQVP